MVLASGGEYKTVVNLPFKDISDNGITMLPDASQIICAVREINTDVWMLENFDPDVQ